MALVAGRFLALAKTRAQRRYPQRISASEQRRPAPKALNPYGAMHKGRLAASLFSLQPACGMRSLAFFAHPPLLPSTRGPFQYFNGLI